MRRVYVGIDAGSKSCAAAVRNNRGRVIEQCEFGTCAQELIDLVVRQKTSDVHVMLEESEMADWMYRTLLPHCAKVVVCDPVTNSWIAKAKRKSDPGDALKLSELLRINSFKSVYHPPGREMADFKTIVRNYEKASERAARAKVQIKAALRRQGIVVTGSRVYGVRGRTAALNSVASPSVRKMLEQQFEMLDFLVNQKAKALRLLRKEAAKRPEIERLMTMPGVGIVLASIFVAYVADPHRFDRRGLHSYAKLGIDSRASGGKMLGREHLSNAGNGALKNVSRKAFEGAIRMRDNGIKRSYQCSAKRTGSLVHARLNTQRKILSIMNAIWRDGTEYSDELAGKGA